MNDLARGSSYVAQGSKLAIMQQWTRTYRTMEITFLYTHQAEQDIDNEGMFYSHFLPGSHSDPLAGIIQATLAPIVTVIKIMNHILVIIVLGPLSLDDFLQIESRVSIASESLRSHRVGLIHVSLWPCETDGS